MDAADAPRAMLSSSSGSMLPLPERPLPDTADDFASGLVVTVKT